MSSHYESFVKELILLHELFEQEKDDSDEGDQIRDRMDVHWRLMTQEEKRSATQKSIELYDTNWKKLVRVQLPID